uniref:Uncharacterized protein n=1 Tax=Octopus bimaculoides TaxID=37653 RepID=A0A0L8G374_OCTBM
MCLCINIYERSFDIVIHSISEKYSRLNKLGKDNQLRSLNSSYPTISILLSWAKVVSSFLRSSFIITRS